MAIAVAGSGLGRFDLVFFGNAFLLFVTNFIGIVLAASITFGIIGHLSVVKVRRALYITLLFL